MEWKLAVLDDLQSDRDRLEKDLHKWFGALGKEVSVSVFSDGLSMSEAFRKGDWQLAFLDICMDGINGIETAKRLRQEDAELLIVFLTTSPEYAFDAFPIHPFDYLMKPYTPESLNRVLSEAARTLSVQDPELTVRASRSELKIPYGQILSASSEGHNVILKLKDGQTVRGTMTFFEAEAKLSKDDRFLTCNRGVLVNMDYVESVSGETLRMSDGSSYPLRTKGRTNLIAAFSQYQISRMKRGK